MKTYHAVVSVAIMYYGIFGIFRSHFITWFPNHRFKGKIFTLTTKRKQIHFTYLSSFWCIFYFIYFRVIREIMQQYGAGDAWRISSQALSALQESAESYITQFMEDSYACTLHRNRITLAPKDMSLVKFLRGVRDSGHE